MKTKRRHELQTNQLADWLGNQIETIKPYSQAIVGGAILVVLVIGFIVIQAGEHQKKKMAVWTSYLDTVTEIEGPTPEDLTELADKNPDTPVGLLAMHAAGDRYLSEGINELYVDRKTAMKMLESAEQAFEKVLKQRDLDPLLRSRARYGLAMSLESQGRLDEAKGEFTKVAESNPNNAIGRLAQSSVRRLENPEIKEFYDRFKDYKRPTSSSTEATQLDPLADFPDLPDRPDLSFPGSDAFDIELNEAGNESDDPQPETDDKESETDESSKESEKEKDEDEKKSSDDKASDNSSEKKKSD